MLTIAGMINAFGVTFFLYPVNLYDSLSMDIKKWGLHLLYIQSMLF